MRQLLEEDSLYPNEEGFEELRKMVYSDEWVDSHIDGSKLTYENFEREGNEIVLNIWDSEREISIRLTHDFSEMTSRIDQHLKQRVLYCGVLLLILGFAIQFVDAAFIQ